MKRLLAALTLFVTPAFAQVQAPPSAEDITSQYLIETGQLRAALGQAQMQLKQLRIQVQELQKKDKSEEKDINPQKLPPVNPEPNKPMGPEIGKPLDK